MFACTKHLRLLELTFEKKFIENCKQTKNYDPEPDCGGK